MQGTSAIDVYARMNQPMVLVIQASMRYAPSRTGHPPSISDCLTTDMQSEFTTCIQDHMQGIQPSPTAPGRLIVSEASPHLCELGDMTSVAASAVHSMAEYAASRSSPLLHYLSICSKHGLCLNKYLTPL